MRNIIPPEGDATAVVATLAYPVIEPAAETWELRDTLTAYDAAYLALARRLDAGLVTLDGGLAVAAAEEGRLVRLETGV
jgi:predicted nucleic acid-binding protein